MNTTLLFNPPAIVREHEDLVMLAKTINNQHELGEFNVRKGLGHYRNAGEALIKAKKLVGHGNWLTWCETHLCFSYQTVKRYMNVTNNWQKVSNCNNLTEAYAILSASPELPITVKNIIKEPIDEVPPVPQPVVEDVDELDIPVQGVEPDEPNEAPVILPHVARNSGDNEWYTPPDYLDAARKVLGVIELDPASSPVAQERVKAVTYYTKDDDGLDHDWHGKIFMNPPYASNLIGKFMSKLRQHVQAGDVPEAVILVNNATETEWMQITAKQASAVCFPKQRIRFLDPEGNTGAPLQGQAVLYLGNHPKNFITEFKSFGFCATIER